MQLLGETSAQDVDKFAELAALGFETVERLGYSSLAGAHPVCPIINKFDEIYLSCCLQRLMTLWTDKITALFGMMHSCSPTADCAGVMELQQMGELVDAGEWTGLRQSGPRQLLNAQMSNPAALHQVLQC